MATTTPILKFEQTAGPNPILPVEGELQDGLEARLALVSDFNRLLLESSGDGILLVEPSGRLISINKKGCELLELDPFAAQPRCSWIDLFPGCDPTLVNQFRSGITGSFSGETSARTARGNTKWWKLIFTPILSPNQGDRILIVARDLTQHTLIEKALREREEAFRKLFEENPIGILVADLEYKTTAVNDAFCGMLGFNQHELIGRDFRSLGMEQHRFFKSDDLQRLLRGEIRSFHLESRYPTRRKEIVWGHSSTSLLRDAENSPLAFFQMIENISERKKSEAQVLAYQQQLQSLASELSLSEERERRQIATNLHDRIGQTLAFAKLKLGSIFQETRSAGVGEVRDLIEHAIVHTRTLTFDLSPPVLYELGLVAAVEWLTRKIQEEHRIPTRFHDDGQAKPIDEKFRIVLFQAVRELLVNVVKHAGASHAQVLIRRDADALRIIIEDDGSGFEPRLLTEKPDHSKSFGLFNIRERVEYLGGKVKIRSEKGRGTRVTLIAPLNLQAAQIE